MFYAYILRPERNPSILYHGFTTDLKGRLATHNQGENVSTRNSRPWKLAWYGGFQTEKAAKDFEHYLKSASGKAIARKWVF